MNDEQLARALIQRLDDQTLWLQRISEQLEQQRTEQKSGYIEQAGKIQSMLDLLVAVSLPTSPELTREQTINAVTPTLLYRNDSLPFARIDVTNDDPAQWVYIGRRNVNILIGRILMPQQNQAFVIPQGEDLWAICIVATVSLRVCEAYDLVGMTQIIRQET